MQANVIVGSTSIHKVNAVQQACADLGISHIVFGVSTSSGANEQPVGFHETFSGALTRARAVKEQHPDSIAIGIESGIFPVSDSEAPSPTLDIAIIVILTPDGREIVTTSKGIQFPEECVKIAKERGFETTTVGSVISETLGGDSTDPHATLTNGKITRAILLTDALVAGLQQL